ncbi:hypothetical protein AHiyo8_41540 [Arthrobacter sp. Hiyo8]|nr:hypothetical protein AHiyo8_41540 [Arthrobacter sp. Hiyo8]
MAVYVDPPLWPAHGTVFSHLVSDTSLEELHAFAEAAGFPGAPSTATTTTSRNAATRTSCPQAPSPWRRAFLCGN